MVSFVDQGQAALQKSTFAGSRGSSQKQAVVGIAHQRTPLQCLTQLLAQGCTLECDQAITHFYLEKDNSFFWV